MSEWCLFGVMSGVCVEMSGVCVDMSGVSTEQSDMCVMQRIPHIHIHVRIKLNNHHTFTHATKRIAPLLQFNEMRDDDSFASTATSNPLSSRTCNAHIKFNEQTPIHNHP